MANFWPSTPRRQQEAELKLIEEETAKRVEEAIRRRVEESLKSEEIELEIQRRLEEGRRKLHHEVELQLEKEKEAAVIEAKRKEVNNMLQSSFYFLTLLFIGALMFVHSGFAFLRLLEEDIRIVYENVF